MSTTTAVSNGSEGKGEEASSSSRWDGLMDRFTKGLDGESLARGWDEVLVKTREKLSEARAKSVELGVEASARSKELAAGATKLGDSLAQRMKEMTASQEVEAEQDEEVGLLEEEPKSMWDDLASRVADGGKEWTRKLGDGTLDLSKKLGDGTREVGGNIVGLGKKLGDGSKDLASRFASSMADSRECGLSRAQRFRWYVGLLFASTCFFGLSFQLIIAPPKFATAFALGTVTSVAAKAMLNGPYTQLRLMIQLRKLPYTLALLASTALTLYLCLTHANTLLIILASFAQIAALLYYVFGDTPGGKAGIKLLFKLILSTAKLIARPFIIAFQ
mmetsp:Transcript_14129/g.44547  ORF Transcript_14129/g.44547 Transcript_14129/m.44547 type:complete len:332 (-) Transcript_14129:185-1180(-)